MFSSKCKKCDGRLANDILITAKSYSKDVGVLIDKDGNSDISLLPEYLVFSCPKCGYIEKVTFVDVQNVLKESFMRALLRARNEEVYIELDKSKILEENGINYCGICPGVLEGDGYCYNDVISQCKVRKLHLHKI